MDLDFERDLLRWVRDPLLLMCVHTFVSPVFSDGDMYTIVRSDGSSRTLRGVTTVISDDLIEDGPPLSSEAKRAKRQIQAALQPTRRVPRTRQERLTGRVAGSLVHRQIEQAVKMRYAAFFEENPEGLHWHGAHLLDYLVNTLHLKPVTAELRVHSEQLGIAYRIDLVCVDEDGILWFVEHKTGYDYGVFLTAAFATKRWRAKTPLAILGAATPCDMALVQHGLGVWLALRNLGLEKRPRETTYRAIVLQIDGTAFRIVELEAAFMDVVIPKVVDFLS